MTCSEGVFLFQSSLCSISFDILRYLERFAKYPKAIPDKTPCECTRIVCMYRRRAVCGLVVVLLSVTLVLL